MTRTAGRPPGMNTAGRAPPSTNPIKILYNKVVPGEGVRYGVPYA